MYTYKMEEQQQQQQCIQEFMRYYVGFFHFILYPRHSVSFQYNELSRMFFHFVLRLTRLSLVNIYLSLDAYHRAQTMLCYFYLGSPLKYNTSPYYFTGFLMNSLKSFFKHLSSRSKFYLYFCCCCC